MNKVEWDTPLMGLVAQLRRLQYACNGLSGKEFAEAMGWDWDDKYVQSKFLEFQALGRLGVFDDSTLSKPVLFYERREERYEATRKAAEERLVAAGLTEREQKQDAVNHHLIEAGEGLVERVERLEDDTHDDNDSIIKLTLRVQDLEGRIKKLEEGLVK